MARIRVARTPSRPRRHPATGPGTSRLPRPVRPRSRRSQRSLPSPKLGLHLYRQASRLGGPEGCGQLTGRAPTATLGPGRSPGCAMDHVPGRGLDCGGTDIAMRGCGDRRRVRHSRRQPDRRPVLGGRPAGDAAGPRPVRRGARDREYGDFQCPSCGASSGWSNLRSALRSSIPGSSDSSGTTSPGSVRNHATRQTPGGVPATRAGSGIPTTCCIAASRARTWAHSRKTG